MNHFNNKLLSLFSLYDSIVFFDFETSGLNHIDDDIIEIGAIQLRKSDNGPLKYKELGTLVKLSKRSSLPSKITAITGITAQMLDENGINIEVAKKELYEMMTKDDKTIIVAHNALFDLSFLVELFKNQKEFFEQIDVIDTLTVFKDRRPYPHKLSDAIMQYNLMEKVQNSHRAIDDVNSLIEVLIAMDEEKNDIIYYCNLIGYNPKYPPKPIYSMPKLKYYPHPYNMRGTLYQKIA